MLGDSGLLVDAFAWACAGARVEAMPAAVADLRKSLRFMAAPLVKKLDADSSGTESAKISCDGGLLDLLHRDVVFCGSTAAVFELGGSVVGFVVPGTYFDTDITVGRGDGGVGAVEAGTAFVVDADAEGAGLAEEEFFESGELGVVGKDSQQGAQTALLHLDGGGHDIEGS